MFVEYFGSNIVIEDQAVSPTICFYCENTPLLFGNISYEYNSLKYLIIKMCMVV